jgi:hypothetical protein
MFAREPKAAMVCALVLMAWSAGPLIAQSEPPDRHGTDAHTFYRYVNAQGRESFTNIPDKLPPSHHTTVYDRNLSRISATSQPNGLDQQPAAAPDETRNCPADQRGARELNFSERLFRLWNDHQPYSAIGAVLLLLILITPTMVGLVSAPVWIHSLSRIIRVIALVTISLLAATQLNRNYLSLLKPSSACGEPGRQGVGPTELYQKTVNSYTKQLDAIVQESRQASQSAQGIDR